MSPELRKSLQTSGAVIVRCQIFSGRRDPQWALSGKQRSQLLAMLDGIQGRTLLKPPGTTGHLGYRGFLITAATDERLAPEATLVVEAGIIDQQRFALNLVDEKNRIERWLLASAGSSIDAALRKRIDLSIRFLPPVLPAAPLKAPAALQKKKKRKRVACRPKWEPSRWNGSAHLALNNCYNYATDVRTDNAALPGEGSGTACCSSDANVTCGKVGAKAVQDGLVKVTGTLTAANPSGAHYVALAVEPAGTPGRDFHWYRRDCDGTWSHKVGNTPARRLDESGNTILDPETSDRGNYTVFCGYYICDPSAVSIF